MVPFRKKCFLWTPFTEYPRQKQGSEMEVKNRQGYQRGGHVYNNEYNTKFPSMIDNQLRHNVRINESGKVRDLKEYFLVQSIKTQNVTPQYQQQDAIISSTVPSNEAADTTTSSKLKWNTKEVNKKKTQQNFYERQMMTPTIQP